MSGVEFASVEGLRIACRDEGERNARAVIFSNSIGTDMRLWDGQAAAMASRFRVIRYDTRGHGQSGVPGEPVTIDQLGRDLLAVLDHFEVEKAHVCGLSLGGMTGMWVAAMHPGRVERMVLANTAARIGSVESWTARMEAVQEGGMAGIRELVVGRFLSKGFRERQPEIADEIGEMLESTDAEGYIAACEALRDADLGSLVLSIQAPVLIVAGALDVSTTPAQAEQLHAAIPLSEIVVFPDTAHLSNIEQPERFNASLLRFFG